MGLSTSQAKHGIAQDIKFGQLNQAVYEILLKIRANTLVFRKHQKESQLHFLLYQIKRFSFNLKNAVGAFTS